MIIDYILLGLTVISFGVIILFICRKFPIISSINTKVIPQQRMKKVKNGLLENRLKRKFLNIKIKTSFHIKPVMDKLKVSLQKFYHQIIEMEKRYEKKMKVMNRPEEKEGLEKKIKILLTEGEKLAKEENFKEAEKKYIEVVSLDRRNTEAYKSLGEIYFQMKEFSHAKEIFQHILKLDEGSDSAYSSLGLIATAEGHLEEAKNDYLQSLAINNKVANHHINLGEIYYSLKKDKKALDCFQEAVRLEPNNPKNLDCLLEACIKCKEKELAKKTFQKLKEVNPENEKLGELKGRIDTI